MKYRRRKIAGTSLLTILGVVCFATIMVSAAVIFLSAPFPRPATVTAPLTISTVTSPDTSYNVWTGAVYPSNKYVDAISVAGTWASTWSLDITIYCATHTISSTTDISMKDFTGTTLVSYGTNIVFSGDGTNTLTAALGAQSALSSSSLQFNFLITLSDIAPAGTYTITYQAAV